MQVGDLVRTRNHNHKQFTVISNQLGTVVEEPEYYVRNGGGHQRWLGHRYNRSYLRLRLHKDESNRQLNDTEKRSIEEKN
jgi:hypothetical protein